MKKRFFSLLLIFALVSALTVTAYADDFTGIVYFDGQRLNSDFTSADIYRAAGYLQPGDETTFTVYLRNDYEQAVDWWMSNEVLTSFEDNNIAEGGAYTYRLAYTDTSGEEHVIYNSETVGGDVGEGQDVGLYSATNALDQLFYLDTIGQGQEPYVTLRVSLDGETQGNDYQDTLADLQLNFAVELSSSTPDTPTNPNPPRTPRVKTGDDFVIVPYVIAAGASGILLLILAIVSLKRRKKEEEQASA
ncbi:MAG: hypothetical protein IJ751_06020 [Oscillospiraceae bacterium]|nr:hypothetical protein [Oscillospiraceae bacterium]